MGWLIYLVLWIASGVLGWGWANYCAYTNDGPESDKEPGKWRLFYAAPIAGPCMLLTNFMTCWFNRKFYFGLRFK